MERDPKAGTTDQKPKWEGPSENRPRGYEPADDNPAEDPDATQTTPSAPSTGDEAEKGADYDAPNSDRPNDLANPSPSKLRNQT